MIIFIEPSRLYTYLHLLCFQMIISTTFLLLILNLLSHLLRFRNCASTKLQYVHGKSDRKAKSIKDLPIMKSNQLPSAHLEIDFYIRKILLNIYLHALNIYLYINIKMPHPDILLAIMNDCYICIDYIT